MTIQNFDLDALERDGDAKEPFKVTFGERDYELLAPVDVDALDLLPAMRAFNAGDPELMLRCIVDEDDREEFFGNPLPMWKLNKMLEAYMKHFGWPAPGKSRSSRRS